MNSITPDLNLMIKACEKASKTLIRDFGEIEKLQVSVKGPSNFVSNADTKAEKIIIEELMKAKKNYSIISEEYGSKINSDSENVWIIDPIDGTSNFLHGIPHFAISIALKSNNEIISGLIYDPIKDEMFCSEKGKGAFKSSPDGDHPISVRQLDDPKNSVVMIAISRRQSREKVLGRMCAKRVYQTLPLGSCSLKACFIAEGKADVFMRIGVTGEWDTGASQCIVSEAGGSIAAANFEPLTYNQRHSLENPDFVVMGDQRVPWQDVVQYNDFVNPHTK